MAYYEVFTYYDRGRLNMRTCFSRHYTRESAKKAWKKITRYYGPLSGHNSLTAKYRVWQETRTGEIINDTGTYGHKAYD